MSTMLVMDMADTAQYKRALSHVKQIDFNGTAMGSTKGVVSLFELTIRSVSEARRAEVRSNGRCMHGPRRYLGGLISAFQLGGAIREQKFLVEQAASLANRLSWGWVGDNVSCAARSASLAC